MAFITSVLLGILAMVSSMPDPGVNIHFDFENVHESNILININGGSAGGINPEFTDKALDANAQTAAAQTTANQTTAAQTTAAQTTTAHTTTAHTTAAKTTAAQTTSAHTTVAKTTEAQTTAIPTTEVPTTAYSLCERPCIYGVCTSYNKCTCDPGWIGDQCESRSRDCTDYYKQGHNTSEPVEVFPYSCCPDESVSIICDQENDGGGWTIIQRRQEVDPRENFARPWTNYVEGFGQLDSEFWIGLKYMHKITTQAEYELRINLEDWEGNTRYASYKVFQVGSAEDKYRLTISGFTGDVGDSMEYHNGARFSTTDQDNHIWSGSGTHTDRCAETHGGGGGWWYVACAHSSLNGRPLKEAEGPSHQGIYWQIWLSANYSLRSVTMKIRPRERTA